MAAGDASCKGFGCSLVEDNDGKWESAALEGGWQLCAAQEGQATQLLSLKQLSLNEKIHQGFLNEACQNSTCTAFTSMARLQVRKRAGCL